jgi:hypothetical protein
VQSRIETRQSDSRRYRKRERTQNKLVEGVGKVVKHNIIISSPLIAQDIHIIINNRRNEIIIKEQKQARRDDEQYIQKGDKRHDNLN